MLFGNYCILSLFKNERFIFFIITDHVYRYREKSQKF